jgi:hypothetical protein
VLGGKVGYMQRRKSVNYLFALPAGMVIGTL